MRNNAKKTTRTTRRPTSALLLEALREGRRLAPYRNHGYSITRYGSGGAHVLVRFNADGDLRGTPVWYSAHGAKTTRVQADKSLKAGR